MSLKGFQKSIVRAPQQFKARFNIGEHTKDPIYQDAERRFQELEKETKKLHDESKKYFDAINGMLNHQIEFSKAMTELYKPISGRASDPSTYTIEGNPEGIQACEEYEAIVRDLQESLSPELELIETRIVSPANQLLEVIKVIRKVAVKRDHKKLDYDRHRNALKKLQEKKDKSLKDEKALYKAENDVEQATQEYNYYNDLLKDELPKLFALEAEFIRPLFQSFYYMQLNVFYTLHEKMQGMNIAYFDLTLDVEEAFEKKRGDVKERAEALTIVHFKTKGLGRQPSKFTPPGKDKMAYESKSTFSRTNRSEETDNPPPPYSASASTVAAAKAKPAPPPPKPKPARFGAAVETVTALYDYEAQAHGDLSFSAGDVIEIIQRTDNQNEWWTGRVDGREGQFPVTREECDRAAAEITGQSVEPVRLQGAFSYTVAAGELLVQFRVPESLLDTERLALARKIYGSVVPACVNRGVIGPSPSLTVYVMDKIPGITYIEVPLTTLCCTSWQEQTVSDFARFFANSWVNRLTEPHRSELSLADLQNKLDILVRQLPPRFSGIISNLREELPAIFVPRYPLALTHTDLCEMNIIVNAKAGGINGIVDWGEAKVLPFGMSLWGIRSMLGTMNSSGWHYHENSSRLEGLFWDTFHRHVGKISDDDKHAMKIAERAGLVLRYGFTWEDGIFERPVNEQDSSIRYLDAFLHRLED
ncbi:amphiphysin [Aspergillus thermomutatus]|uniref:BAR domain-containing protein n=1 Tax=Aspergillus thermomutatus TaxID=41047 RepID=A0A397GGD5_ASPTH|nr:uncharacterized protein CDV56_100428 [Aspergillus thermomutatus]RHZ48874.1 hypothetical protein CDV56_100428 [Aspergillus thermomutatus]